MADASTVTGSVLPPPYWSSGRAARVGVCLLRLPWELLCFGRHLFGILVWLVHPHYARAARLIPCRYGAGLDLAGGRAHECVRGARYRNRWLLRLLCGEVAVVPGPGGASVCVCAKGGRFRPPLATFMIFSAALVLGVGGGVWIVLRLLS